MGGDPFKGRDAIDIDDLLGFNDEDDDAEDKSFRGQTYDAALDFDRLTNNLQRVFALLLDGQWHSAEELRQVGGSEATRRARDLRGETWGPLDVAAERIEGGSWRYRLNLGSVTDRIRDKILTKNPDVPTRTKALRIENIKNVLGKATDGQIAAVESLLGISSDDVDIDLLDLG